MNELMIIGIGAFLCAVFAVLGWLHRCVQSAEDRELQQKIEEAKASGSNQALTQHPQIDSDHCMGCGSCALACPEHGVLAVVDGRARLVNASHCVGHGHCEVVCPVGALVVGLGDTSKRTDIPILSEERETSVPGVFISGELGGIGLIRHAITQGTKVVETIAARLKRLPAEARNTALLDILIVGSGPSGIASALRAHELGLHFAIIDQDGIGGAVRKYPRNKLTLTQPVDLPVYGRMTKSQYAKEDLIELWEGILAETGINVQAGIKLSGVSSNADGTLTAATSTGKIACRNVVLALGRRGTPRRLGVPGEASERVLYQLIDAADHSNQDLLVVGGGDSAIEAALGLAVQPGNRVTLSYRRHAFFRIKPRNRDGLEEQVKAGRIKVIFNSDVKSIEFTRTIISVKPDETSPAEEMAVPAEFVFVFAGGEPPYPLLKKIGIRFGGEAEVEREQAAKEMMVAG